MVRPRARPRTTRVRLARGLVAALLGFGSLAAPAVAPAAAYPAPATAATRAPVRSDLAERLQADLVTYLRARGAAEHVSAAALSVSLRGHRTSIDVAAGTTTYGGCHPVRTDSLWQIGSNTKAFTSVVLLQLEAEHRLSINDPLGHWLPQYHRWRTVTIKRLLNMTSGIPSYDENPAFMTAYAADPYRYFPAPRLVSYAASLRATTGYSYSNTNYVLAEMVIERVTHDSYRHELYDRLIRPLGLDDLHYRTHLYPSGVTRREPAGYFFDARLRPLAPILRRDVSRDSLSFARGAGGIVSTTHDMTVWERALYDGRLLPRRQQAELLSLVSTRTGRPIPRTSPSDPGGFGLGVAQGTAPRLGTVWLYEGGTLGFRTLHLYFPASGTIMAMGLNSAPTQDRIMLLALSVYRTLQQAGATVSVVAPTAAPARR